MNEKVNSMKNFPSNVLVGASFWSRNDLLPDFSSMTGKIKVDEQMFIEVIRHREEAKNVTAVQESPGSAGGSKDRFLESFIKTMDLGLFSEEKSEVGSLRKPIWDFRELFSGYGYVNGVEHKTELRQNASPACVPVQNTVTCPRGCGETRSHEALRNRCFRTNYLSVGSGKRVCSTEERGSSHDNRL